ncbi:MAG: outer membrane beta-barrel protein [Planctomycetales bacterium]
MIDREVKQKLLGRLMSAAALIGALGLAGLEPSQAEDAQPRRNVFRRMAARLSGRTQAPRAIDSEIEQIQAQESELPAFERADDKERPFEEPGASQAPNFSDTPGPETQPAFERADDKETAPEEPASAWTLTNLFDDDAGNNVLKDNGWKLSGHSAWGYQNAPDGSFDGHGPFLSQQGWGQFNLNQQYLYIEKIANGKDGLDWGVRFDVMYGTQGFEGQSFGNIDAGHWDYLNGFDHGAYNWALPQLYGEVAYGDLSVKLGHFYTIVGYEVVPSTGNFFMSRQLTFFNSEPFNHTGALATYKANDKLTLLGGWVLGWDTGFYQYNQGNSFLGGATYAVDEKTTFVYSMAAGNFGWRGQGAINSMILSRQWTEKFATVAQFDVFNSNLVLADGTPADFNTSAGGFTPRDSVSFITYAFYDLNSKVKGGVRYEWYKPDGTSYNTFTFGLNYKPYSNVIIRPEARIMWAPGNQNIYTGAHGYSGQLFNQTVFGIDAIVTF